MIVTERGRDLWAVPNMAEMPNKSGSSCNQSNECYIRTKTSAILRELGIPSHLAGYLYLVEAVVMVAQEPTLLRRVTAGLYLALADRYHTTPAAVERAIRHAVETGCCRCDPEILAYYFGSTVSPRRGKPNNSEMIARLVNLVGQGVMM